ncbi:MFS transporter [Aggregatimonas sangjinii]|uniref:MFS transporter n=1 Tax=Aggregatimonas sangjinii TaxID=2583587 RepID=A0A5B7SUQ9_9FLAO|nr:MFS transporter [Aggregatimonas sangjinii]QCX00404.1 MFS transporter [Aggregatimonas sangjinii]
MRTRPHILPIIILSQFACTSLWFSGNAIVEELTAKTGLGTEIIGYVLSSVQFGFISGTLVFALFMIADRFSPSRVFLVCAILAALCNMALLSDELSKWSLLSARFGTGFFLAGIYPVGMKIAADYYEKGLGKALGFLVGALVSGTALPYFLVGTPWGNHPDSVIKTVSTLAVFGGLLLWVFVPNGPFRMRSVKLQLQLGPSLFKIVGFRKAAFGYFGHMWELYAFWAFTPLAIQYHAEMSSENLSVPIWTGIIIALGGLSCILGGIRSQKIGSHKVAFRALLLSGTFCLLSPLLFHLPSYLFLIGWCLWGMAVTADSPQFSSLVAGALPPEVKGTGLTLVNCIGFGLTIVSIQLLTYFSEKIALQYLFLPLLIGPVIGLWHLSKKSS